jgi:hypothetical protein
MSSDPNVERCLSLVRELSDALVEQLLVVSARAWDGPTNCAPWRVRDIAVHLVSSGEGFAASIRRGLAGSVEPGDVSEARQRRQAELEAANAQAIGRELKTVTDEFTGLYAGLQDQELIAVLTSGGEIPAEWEPYSDRRGTLTATLVKRPRCPGRTFRPAHWSTHMRWFHDCSTLVKLLATFTSSCASSSQVIDDSRPWRHLPGDKRLI